jgi:hypothetical protein
VRATDDVLDGIKLFVRNPVNPLATHYPGLSSITAFLSEASGLSVFTVGNILILAARVLMLLSLLVFFGRLLASPRVAGLAVLLYAANPAFFYFDAQFSYESLALPLAVVILTLAFVGPFEGTRNRIVMGTCAFAALGVVVTHHVSSYGLALLMLTFAAGLWLFEPDNRPLARRLAILGLFTAAAATLWWTFVAGDTWRYLSKDIGSNLNAVPNFVTGDTGARSPFSGTAFPIPSYEIWASYLGVFVLGLSYVIGTVSSWAADPDRRGRYAACIVVGALYFLSLPLQLLQEAGAAPIAPRIWEFSFIGLAPIAALGLRRLALARWPATGVAAAVSLVMILASGVVIRSGDNIRFPGPYLPSSGPRAVTPDAVAAARWLNREYGPGRVVMGDFTLASVFGSYGGAKPASYQNYGVRPWRVFFSSRLNGPGRFELDQSATEFVAVDRRLTKKQPYTDFYFSDAEPERQARLLPESYLRKFDTSPEFERVYEGGNIAIYRYLGRDLP